MDQVTPSNSDSSIQSIIKQAETMQMKLKLEVQFKKNISFLQKNSPNIYDRFKDFKPKQQKIYIDENGNINLLNIYSRNPAFEQNPITFSKTQAHTFMLSPTRFVSGFKPSPIVNDDIHPLITNQAISEYTELGLEKSQYNPKNPIGLLVMIGCGLGYHIQEIIEHYDVRNIFIYDQNEDSFYASLFTIDWESIVTKLNDKGGVLKLHVGTDLVTTLMHMRHLPYEIGMHNMVATHVYKHTNSPGNDEFYKQYYSEFHLYGTALGFFDDERVSFAHTIHSMNANLPILVKGNTKKLSLPPVIIIGNGPSLDNLVELIKDNQKNAILISCSSALTSLYKLGIEPDFHVELERNYTIAEMLKLGTSLDYTKKIRLLGINTISPEVISLFKSTHLASKPNDIGASLLEKSIPKDQYIELGYCNPTVTNCALSYAVELGFGEIYLAGIDLGMKDEDNHHSKFSLWHDIDQNQQQGKEVLGDYAYKEDTRYPIKGNFCDKVTTTSVLDSSRKNLESLIKNNPDLNFYNLNDGAYILGAKPTRQEKVLLDKEIDNREKTTEQILKSNFNCFNFPKIDKEYVDKNYTALYFKIHEGVELPETCSDISDLYKHMHRVFKNMKALEAVDKTTSMLLMGSIQVQFSMLYYHCLRAENNEDFTKCYAIGKKHYDELIEQATEILKKDPLALDKTMLLKE